MAKPFDLEKAKAGAKVIWRDTTVNYIGTSAHDGSLHVIETLPVGTTRSSSIWYAHESDLSMAPVKVTRYINLYPASGHDSAYGVGEYTLYPNKEKAEASANYDTAIAVAVPIEVEE